MSLEGFPRRINRAVFLLLLTDLFSFCLSYGLAILVRRALDPVVTGPLQEFKAYGLLIFFNLLIMLLIFMLMGLYRGNGTVAVVELRNLTLSILITYIIMTFAAYLMGEGERISRLVFGFSLIFCLFFVPLLRFVIYNRFSRFSTWGVRVAVIASREEYLDITTRLRKIQRLGFNPEIILCIDLLPSERLYFDGILVESYSLEACQKVRAKGIDIAYYTSKDLAEDDPVLMAISCIFPTVYYVLPESNLSSLWIETVDLLGRPALKASYHLLDEVPKFIKGTIEKFICLISLIFLSPLVLLISLMIKIEAKGPILFYQERLGLNGRPFKLIKFRTMVPNAETILEQYLYQNPQSKAEYTNYRKLHNDPRITRLGAFLRKFSLDEIPQLINVILGQMNLIGPRAYMVNELDIKSPVTQTILRVKPGLTGWWQVMGRNGATFKERQKLDIYYISNWSLWLDYYIFIKSIWIVISGQGK